MAEFVRAAGDPHTDEDDEGDVAANADFDLMGKLFRRRLAVAEIAVQLRLVGRGSLSKHRIPVVMPFAWAAAIQNSGVPVHSEP